VSFRYFSLDGQVAWLNVTSTTNLAVGMTVQGVGVASGCEITAIVDANTIEISPAIYVTQGTVLTFTASASDVDGSVAGVEFFVNNVSIGVDNTAPYTMNHTAVLGSGQTVKAVATDDLGLTGTSNIVTMNVLANVPPTVAITAPTSSAVISSYASAAAAEAKKMQEEMAVYL
jgi:hypothetical protein